MSIEGTFVESDKPMVPASVAWNQAVQTPHFILDTGFTGDLVVTPEIATDLGLEITGVSPARVAGSGLVNIPTATALAVMEGRQLYVTVFIVEDWPLLGISFMEKFQYRAEIDCKNKKVKLEIVQ
jgi:predicted aspartyl protease